MLAAENIPASKALLGRSRIEKRGLCGKKNWGLDNAGLVCLFLSGFVCLVCFGRGGFRGLHLRIF